MRYKQSIIKFASVLLILMLMQKMVGGLYLHNWLHGSRNYIAQQDGEKAVAQFNCTCIDDFYIPFTEPVIISLETPVNVDPSFLAVPSVVLAIIPRQFQALRGPPVFS